jgi:AbrB family looped-hinge helix DNA binding protein
MACPFCFGAPLDLKAFNDAGMKWYKKWYLLWYYGIMNTMRSIDRAGRLVLPKRVREQLQIEPGESLEMQSFEDHVVLRPVRAKGSMRKKQGVWVFSGGSPLKASTVRETIQRIRKDREHAALGTKL